MLIHGDGDGLRIASTEELCARLAHDVSELAEARGYARHVIALRTLLDAGEIAQGLLDAECGAGGASSLSAVGLLATRLLRASARCLTSSRFVPELPALVRELRSQKLPWTLRVVEPAGYVQNASYPELWARAAAKLDGGGPLTVIGIRPIGASLGAVVAEATGAQDFITVRPSTSFHSLRDVQVTDALARVALRKERSVIVVDDGKEIAFAAVSTMLDARGVSRECVVRFPNQDVGPAVLAAIGAGIPRDAIDLSGGAWREIVFRDASQYPPAFAARERLKFLVRKKTGAILYKFAGLGRYGERKLARARHLAQRGLAPRVHDLRHGFLGMEWALGSCPWPLEAQGSARDAFVDGVGRYLGEIATSHATGAPRGASVSELLTMAEHNTRELLGREHAAELRRYREEVDELESQVRPRWTDNHMMPWEWIVTRDGRVLKCDALDHAMGHDMIGPQDLAWDVAGAWTELDLSEAEVARLLDQVSRVHEQHALARKLPVYILFYLAFRGGELELARRAAASDDERARIVRAKRRVAERLRRLLERMPSTHPLEMSL